MWAILASTNPVSNFNLFSGGGSHNDDDDDDDLGKIVVTGIFVLSVLPGREKGSCLSIVDGTDRIVNDAADKEDEDEIFSET